MEAWFTSKGFSINFEDGLAFNSGVVRGAGPVLPDFIKVYSDEINNNIECQCKN